MSFIIVKDLSKSHSKLKALDKISFKIERGEFVSILGPNGSGKTTLLHLVAGLDKDYAGKIEFKEKPKFGFIFQNSEESLLPWKTVLQNLYLDKNFDHVKCRQILKQTQLWHFRNNYPYELSGGMKQLLAISRAFVYECNLLLLDEPFSSLDLEMSTSVRTMLLNLWKKEKPAVIFISHNIEDSILLSDKIFVMSKRPGRIKSIIQINMPRHLRSQHIQKYRTQILAALENE